MHCINPKCNHGLALPRLALCYTNSERIHSEIKTQSCTFFFRGVQFQSIFFLRPSSPLLACPSTSPAPAAPPLLPLCRALGEGVGFARGGVFPLESWKSGENLRTVKNKDKENAWPGQTLFSFVSFSALQGEIFFQKNFSLRFPEDPWCGPRQRWSSRCGLWLRRRVETGQLLRHHHGLLLQRLPTNTYWKSIVNYSFSKSFPHIWYK